MLNKRIISALMILAALSCVIFMGGCQKISYGGVIDTQENLVKTMSDAKLNFKYPDYLGEKGENGESQFVAVKENGEYSGYKIYQFGSPFYSSVTAFNKTSDKLLSDEESRTVFLKNLPSEKGEIAVYSGKGHKDALYFIGILNIDSYHYEIRVTSDEVMEDNNYVHAIYDGNEYYEKSLDLIVKIAESMS